MTITASADGSALGNPGPMGWAWFIDEEQWAAGGSRHGTNNIGELTAVLELLRATKAAGCAGDDLVVLCDSQYVINSVTKWMPGWKRKGWKKADGKPVLNVDLMKALDAEMRGRSVRFEWVKGHAGHEMNEAADERARAAATAYQRGVTPNEGPGMKGAASSSDTEATTDPYDVPPREEEAPRDLFSGFDELRARRERREREGFDDPCAVTLSATDAERALWAPEEPVAVGAGTDHVWAQRRESVLADGAQLIDENGQQLNPREWARILANFAEGDGFRAATIHSITDTNVGPDMSLVDAEIVAGGRTWRVSSLWNTRAGGTELVFHRWSEMR